MLQARFKSLFSSHNAMMLLCCVAMVVGFFAILGKGGSTLSALAPLAICLGLHLVMHKMMGKSCHGSEHKKESAEEAMAVIPTEPKRITHQAN